MAIDTDGHPYLLFEANRREEQPDLELKSVEVRFECPCDIQLQDGIELTGRYTLVSLKDDDPDIVRVFLRLLQEAFLESENDHSAAIIRQKILMIADIFAPQSDDVRDVLGLWGELHVIRSSLDTNAAVKAWSSSPRARYDFITSKFAVEVKTTLRGSRQHRFSLEQLRPDSELKVIVSSILLVEQQGGETVSELMDNIYAGLLSHDERTHFFRQCIRKGGVDIYGSALRLSLLPDNASVVIYNAAKLPTPKVAENHPVSNVRFDLVMSELDHARLDSKVEELDFNS